MLNELICGREIRGYRELKYTYDSVPMDAHKTYVYNRQQDIDWKCIYRRMHY